MNGLKVLAQTDNEIRVGNYLILFGGRDLAGEFFTKNTQVESTYTAMDVLYEDFEHGMDPDGIGNSEDNVLGVVDWKSRKVDQNGIYVERILKRQAEYMDYLQQLIDMGVMGTSSAAIPGKTMRSDKGEITKWPLMRDSLTVTPMEPRMVTSNILRAAKALAEVFPNSKSLVRLANRVEPGEKGIVSIETLSAVEDYLRDAGMSRREAMTLISQVKSLGVRDAAEAKALREVTEAIKRRGEILNPVPRDTDAGLQKLTAALRRRGQLLAV